MQKIGAPWSSDQSDSLMIQEVVGSNPSWTNQKTLCQFSNKYVFYCESKTNNTAKREQWAPPFICCAQDTTGENKSQSKRKHFLILLLSFITLLLNNTSKKDTCQFQFKIDMKEGFKRRHLLHNTAVQQFCCKFMFRR